VKATSKAHITSDSELTVLAAVYSLAVQKCQEKQRATRPDRHDDRKKFLNKERRLTWPDK
jgi:hypothetical protein